MEGKRIDRCTSLPLILNDQLSDFHKCLYPTDITMYCGGVEKYVPRNRQKCRWQRSWWKAREDNITVCQLRNVFNREPFSVSRSSSSRNCSVNTYRMRFKELRDGGAHTDNLKKKLHKKNISLACNVWGLMIGFWLLVTPIDSGLHRSLIVS